MREELSECDHLCAIYVNAIKATISNVVNSRSANTHVAADSEAIPRANNARYVRNFFDIVGRMGKRNTAILTEYLFVILRVGRQAS